MKKSVSKIILLLVLLLQLALLLSLWRRNQNYEKITSTTYDIIKFDSFTNSLWVADLVDDKIFIASASSTGNFNFHKAKQIDLPVNMVVYSFCIMKDDVWIALADISGSGSSAIYKFNKLKDGMVKFFDFDAVKCRLLDGNRVAFWGKNKVLIVDSTNEEATEFDVPEFIYDIAQDQAGNIWIVTTDGRIYQKDHSNALQLSLNEGRYSKIFFDVEGNLWVANHQHIVLYKKDNLSGGGEEIINDDMGIMYSAFQEEKESIWFIMSENIIVYDNGQISDVNLPVGIKNIRFGGVDSVNKLAFISSNKGVYLLSLR